MARKFQPLTLGLIEEGELVRDFNKEFRIQQEKLCAHVTEHGERAKGATTEITLRIVVKCNDPTDEIFAVKTSMTKKDPQRPSRTTTAISQMGDNGQVGLFARASGTDGNEPRQQKLATDDGRAIDQETGEVIDYADTKGGDA